ncbi:MAG: ribosomal protein S18-alanine N-acetyltransferase [Candidatus Krumholzibacteriia bacterium]
MSDAPVRLRHASLDDLPAVDRIERASFGDPWSLDALAQELVPSPLRTPLVAVLHGAVVGYLMAWRTLDQLHILNVAVDPAWRRRGIGAQLLRAAMAEARAGGMREVTLEVRRGNRNAIAMYRAHGFAETGVRRGYYQDTGEDAIVLTCPIQP